MHRTATLVAGPVALVLSACQPFGPASETVSGALSYPAGITLPPDAVAVVSVVDISPVDARDALLGRTEIVGPGTTPIPFEVRYLPAAVKEDRQYGVRAQIAVDEELWLTTDLPYPVLTGGASRHTEVMLVRPSSDALE